MLCIMAKLFLDNNLAVSSEFLYTVGMKNESKIMNDKELYELLFYVAFCGRVDSAVFDAAEKKDTKFFETLVSNWKEKNL